MENKWYQQTWAKITGAIVVMGTLGTIGTGVVNTVNHWNFYQALPARLDSIENHVKTLEEGDKEFENFFDKKGNSFAVGFRVDKTKDEHTNEIMWVKKYRDWKGRLNNIYIDHELTDFYGVDQYYYIDKDTHEKVYCW
jgi:hypothetical protein